MSETTNKPTGLKIERKGNAFVLTFGKGDKDYGDGLQFKYGVRYQGDSTIWWSDIEKLGVSKTTAKAKLTLANFYPLKAGSTPVDLVRMAVRGNRKKYTSGSGKKAKTVNPGWSDWATKDFDIKKPNTPTLTAALDSGQSNKTTFTWETEVSDSAVQMFTDVCYETILIADCTEKDGSKIKWDSSDSTYEKATGQAASDSKAVVETTATLASGSFTRWFRVWARGPQGDTGYVYASHVYSKTEKAEIKEDEDNKPNAADNDSSGMDVIVTWDAPSDDSKPIDDTIVQYCITVPAAGMSFPAGESWTDADTQGDTDNLGTAAFQIDDQLGDDECLFVRVNTKHDTSITYGTPKLVKVGALSDPSGLSVSTDDTTHRATVTATNNSDVPDSFLVVVYKASSDSMGSIDIGIIPHGQSSVTVQGPDWSEEDAIAFGVYAAVGSYTAVTRNDGADGYAVTALMRSKTTLWKGGDVPKAPSNVSAVPGEKSGSILVNWSWPWSEANGAELSWSDHDDAWESTEEPETYEVSYLRASRWIISGLDTGKTWYVRVRLFIASGDERTYGPWSGLYEVDLSEAPSVPVLTLSAGTITPDGKVNAYWAYSSNDGTVQRFAEICEVTISGGVATYDDIIARTDTEQRMVLDAAKLGWSAGELHYLAVRVMSSAGRFSDSWSNIVSVRVAPALSCSITTGLVSETVTKESESFTYLALKSLPLTVTASGGDETCDLEVAIERAEDYRLMRPDEKESDGYENETVVLKRVPNVGSVSIGAEDLIGALDDGAAYRLIATIRDGLGRAASSDPIEFRVSWSHQAIIPRGRVHVDNANCVALITPVAPDGAVSTDRCDIYRLSLGYPELIVKDAEFGKTYVDPYPAIGDMGGHRVVFRTAVGDYITADNELAWKDFGEEDFDELDIPHNIIDFGNDRAEFEYDVDLSDDHEKDFTETSYLDGSVVGDFGKAVKGSFSINTVIMTEDIDMIKTLARLADYAGPAHVRTKDGYSYWANVEVHRELKVQTAHKMAAFSFKAKRIDAEEPDGVLLEDWK